MLRCPVRIVVALLILARCVGANAQAPGIQYMYDQLGRLIAVIDLTGDTANYTYDAAGNLLSIQRYDSSRISIITCAPNRGPVGTPVTIFGTGFSVTPGENAVTFHDIGASVVSATVTQLVVIIPVGATTGPISITSPAGSATSSAPFTVTADSGTPTITNFTPTIGLAGTPISVTGSNFATVQLNNRVTLNSSVVNVTSGSTTMLSTSVPSQTMGGRIQIATDRGSVMSEADFVVPPAPYTAADVVVTDRITIGAGTSVSIGASGKVGLVLFDGTRGQRVAIRVSNSTIAGAHITIYRPDGLVLAASGAIGGAGGLIEAQILPATGSYTLLVDPDSTYTGHLTLNAYDVVDVSGPIAADGTGVQVSITTPSQNARLIFDGVAGQVVTARVTNGTFSSYCFDLSLSILKSDGTTLRTTNSCSGSSAFLDQLTLPATGTYTLFLNPDTTQTGTATVTLFNAGDLTGPITADGMGVPVSITAPGQNARLTFSGTAGQVVTARMATGTFSSYCFALSLSVVAADGTTLRTTSSCSGSSAFIDQLTLPATGTYTLFLNPDTAQTGTATLTLYNAGDVTGPITADGTGVPVSITAPGQNARLTFSGTAGQVVTARVATGTFSSYCFALSLSVLASDGTTLRTTSSCSGSGAFIDQLTLPATGPYTLFLNPDTAQTGTATLTLYNAGDVTGPITADGTGVPVSITAPGQNARLTFSGTAGQVVTGRVATGTFSSYCFALSLSVLASDGTTLRTTSSCSGSGAFIDQLTLPANGTYTLLLNPDAALTGSATLTLYTIVDVTGSIDAGGAAVPVSIATPGQNARLTFNGTAGQVVSARVANGTFSSYCFDFSLAILKADGTTLGSSTSCSGSSATLGQKTLPTTGVYTLSFNPDAALTGAATVTLTSP